MTRKLSDPPPRSFDADGQMNDFGQALIVLTRELWVITDRLAVLEKILENNGVAPGMIDAYQPDEAFNLALDIRRKALLDDVIAALLGRNA